ncbi:MAG TPA: signal recognition particle-docking protein FtsY, partial [Lachnospiraceae bacterium]|nr:signal recognition particle-docking protein FtsY [Lachnospiraceae bacterium]
MALFDWFTKKNKKDVPEETDDNLEKVTDLHNEDETEQEEPLETETEQYSSEETQQEEISQELESVEEETTEIVEEDVQEDVPSQEDFDNAEEEAAAETETEPAEEKKLSFFEKIKAGLQKTRSNIMSGIEGVFKSFTKIDDEFYEELEEVLIMADVGTVTSSYIIEELKERVKSKKLHDLEEVRKELIKVIEEILTDENEAAELPTPTVILVIGVNGVGKTTTIGKLTARYQSEGKSVMLAAADTFRAAAIDQLQVWADRNKVQLIKHQENSDPGAVVFDAVKAAKSRNTDILICDTAGRLHNKK